MLPNTRDHSSPIFSLVPPSDLTLFLHHPLPLLAPLFCFCGVNSYLRFQKVSEKSKVFVFLWQAYFTQWNALQVHPHCRNNKNLCFSWQNYTPLYTHFIYSSITGHLVCFLILDIVNRPEITVGTNLYLSLSLCACSHVWVHICKCMYIHVCMCACRYRPECKVGCHSSKPYSLFTETKVTNDYNGWPVRPRDPPIFSFLRAEMRLQAYTAAPRFSLHDKHFTNWAISLGLNMALFVSFGSVHPAAPPLGWLAVLLTDFTPFAIMTVLIYILISKIYMLALENKPFIHIYLCVNKRILLVVWWPWFWKHSLNFESQTIPHMTSLTLWCLGVELHSQSIIDLTALHWASTIGQKLLGSLSISLWSITLGGRLHHLVKGKQCINTNLQEFQMMQQTS